MKRFFTLALSLLLSTQLVFTGFSQISQGGSPRSFQKLLPWVDVPAVQMGTVDVDKLRAEDAERRKLGKEFDRRFGFTFDVALNPANSGIWTTLPNGDRVWRMAIESKGALTINLTFSKYYLPPGADLFIVGLQKQDILGAFTSFNNQADEQLGTTLVRGDKTYLEYYEPAAVAGKGKLEVGKVTHGYKDVFGVTGFGESGLCNRNVNCPEGALWQNEKRAVARIVYNGDWCTGALINNAMEDGKPYFLTANHCYNTGISTWVFAFNWEAVACADPGSSPALSQTISGSTLISKNAKSDFCLLLLSSTPPASFKPYYAGWNNAPAAPTKSVIIHHPSGDIKKITFDNDISTSTGYGSGPSDDSHWTTSNYESGTTEGGSSGSPQFDQDHYIVGQLHGGLASCSNNTYDRYGKVSMSWNEGTTPATRLRDWLDPLNSGITKLSAYDPACVKVAVTLPWKKDLDTVTQLVPKLWRVKNPNGDSTFRLVSGGYGNLSGKAFTINAESFDPAGRGDTLILSPITTSSYKNLKLKWNHAYRRKNHSVSDSLYLLVSRNCGASFQRLKSWADTSLVTDTNTAIGAAFFPTDTSAWRKNLISLDASFNRAESLVFAFGFKSGNAGTLWLDEFELIGDTAKNKPSALFASNTTSGCAGTQIQFSDSSANNPTQWLWTFVGGTPAFSTEENPVVTYNASGSYPVKLVATNDEGSDTLTQQNLIEIITIGQTNTPLSQSFNGGGTFPPTGYILQNPENDVTWVVNNAITAPSSPGGSLMFDNFASPNVTGTKDQLVFPQIPTAGKSHLKMSFKRAYKYYTTGGAPAPDTLTVGFTKQCGGAVYPLWKKGGQELATAGNLQASYTPQAADWAKVTLDLDSLLAYPEISLVFTNLFGFGNRIFLDDIYLDTTAVVSNKSFDLETSLVSVPNPTTGNITIKGSKAGAFQLISIYNSVGKEMDLHGLIRNSEGDLDLSLQHLPSGAYMIKLGSSKQICNLNVLKN